MRHGGHPVNRATIARTGLALECRHRNQRCGRLR